MRLGVRWAGLILASSVAIAACSEDRVDPGGHAAQAEVAGPAGVEPVRIDGQSFFFVPPPVPTWGVARLDCIREVGPDATGHELVARIWNGVIAEQAWIETSLGELGIDLPGDLREVGFFSLGGDETIYVVARMRKPDNTAAMLLTLARHGGTEPSLERTGDTDAVSFARRGGTTRLRATVRPVPGDGDLHVLFVQRGEGRGVLEIPASEPSARDARVREILQVAEDPTHACVLARTEQVQGRLPVPGESAPRLARAVLSLRPRAVDDVAAEAVALSSSPTLTARLDYAGDAPAPEMMQRWLAGQLAALLGSLAGDHAVASLVDAALHRALRVDGDPNSIVATLSTRNVTRAELAELRSDSSGGL